MDMTHFDLSSYAVDTGGIPQAYYIPDFVSEDEEAYLLRQIYNAPIPKWKNLENRRLQVWGGNLTSSNKLLAQALPPFLTKYPDIIGRLQSTGAFSNSKHGAPNHVIINEYLPLQGIMPHEDGPSYHPVVATISLRSHTVFHYYRYKSETAGEEHLDSIRQSYQSHEAISETQNAAPTMMDMNSSGMSTTCRGRVIDMTRPVLSLLLEPRSLVITTRELYTDHLHGIDPLAEDVFLPASSESSALDSISEDRNVDGLAVGAGPGARVANWKMVKDSKLRDIVTNGGTLHRGERFSLTCRDVESIISMRALR